MGNWTRDLRDGLRRLGQAPLFSLTVGLTLALGLGANTAIFTLVHAILLRRLPVPHAEQLARIGDGDECCVEGGFTGDGDDGENDIFSFAEYRLFQAGTPEFVSLAAAQAGQDEFAARRGAAPAVTLNGELVSGNYFSTLGVTAAAGRLFAPGDDEPAAPPVAVLSYAAWRQVYGGDRAMLGGTLLLESHPFTVVGVAPRGFFGDRVSDRAPQVWVPLATEPLVYNQQSEPPDSWLLNQPGLQWLYPIGRLRPGVNRSAVQAKVSEELRGWMATQPSFTRNGEDKLIPRQHVVVVSAAGGVQAMQRESGAGLKLLMLLAGVVLAIACANIASALLARSLARRGEVALRQALGESRARVLRRVLTETVALSLLGGLAGLGVAWAASRAILALALPDMRNSAIHPQPTPEVLAFAFGLALLTGVLFGLAPAWAATHARPADALRGVGHAARDRSRLPQYALIVLQAALALVLVAGALLLARSLGNLQNQNLGVATANRYVVHFDVPGAGYTPATAPALYRQIEAGVGALPGVRALGLGIYSPLEGDNWGECVIPEGQPAPGPGARCGATWDRVGNGFLDAVGVPIVAGRGFTPQDTATSPPVALVNQAFVQRFFPHREAVGRRFGIDFPQYSQAFEIVGVFRDFKMSNPRRPVRPTFLRPVTQLYAGYTQPDMKSGEVASMFMGSMVVAYAQAPASADAQLRRAFAAIDPNLTLDRVQSFATQVADNFSQERLISHLAGLFAGLALLLAAIGLYGVTSYGVARRAPELGVRMALGASGGNVLALVLRGVMLQAGLGLLVGVPAAVAAGRLLKSQLYNLGGLDARSLALAAAALVACALGAGYLPARRAAAIDPLVTLRAE